MVFLHALVILRTYLSSVDIVGSSQFKSELNSLKAFQKVSDSNSLVFQAQSVACRMFLVYLKLKLKSIS